MFCPQCGMYNEDAVARCTGCGIPLDSAVPDSPDLDEERSVPQRPDVAELAPYLVPRIAGLVGAVIVLSLLTARSGQIALRAGAGILGERQDRTRIIAGRGPVGRRDIHAVESVERSRPDPTADWRRASPEGPSARQPSRQDVLYSPRWVDGIEIGRADGSRAEFDYGRGCGWPRRNVEAWYDLVRQRMRFGNDRWGPYSQLLDPLPEALQGPRDPANANSQNPIHFIFRLNRPQDVFLEVKWLEAMGRGCLVRISLNGEEIHEAMVRSRSTTDLILPAAGTRTGDNDLTFESRDYWIRWDVISIRPTGRTAATEPEPAAPIPTGTPAVNPPSTPASRPGDIRLEAESLPVTQLANGTPVVQDMTDFGTTWSGGKQFRFDPEGVPASVTLQVSVPQTRRYRIFLRFTKAPDAGVFGLWINGTRLGSLIDGYSPGVLPSGLTDVGVTELTAGRNLFEFRVGSKNPNAKQYLLGVDYLVLRPVR